MSAESIPLAMFVGTWLVYSETFIYDQLQHQNRFSTTVFALRRSPEASRFPFERIVTPTAWERAACQFLGRCPTFVRELRASSARAIHAHFGTAGVIATPFARALDLPLAVTFHGHDVSGLLPQNRWSSTYALYQRRAPAMFDRATLLVCASQELADMLLSLGAPASKIRVHRLGVDLDRWSVPTRSEGPVCVLMIGRFVEKKGMTYGIDAFAEVWRRHPDIRLRIVGGGPLQAALVARVEALGLADAVTFVGVLRPEQIELELAGAHVLMAPSVVARNGDRESGVIVIKEAGASGLPTIGTRHGGIPEIIEHGETGYLVPERDPRAIAEYLRTLVEDSELRLRLGRAARAAMEEHYDTRRQNQRLEALLATML